LNGEFGEFEENGEYYQGQVQCLENTDRRGCETDPNFNLSLLSTDSKRSKIE